MTADILELPEALQGFGLDRYAQLGAKVIYHWPDRRTIKASLRRWMFEGLEFADAEIAKTADFRRHTFGLHFFTSWDEAEAWLRGDPTHDGFDSQTCSACAVAAKAHGLTPKRKWTFVGEPAPTPEPAK